MAQRKFTDIAAEENKERQRAVLFESLSNRIADLKGTQIPRLKARAKARNDDLLAIRQCAEAAAKLPPDVGVAKGRDLTFVINEALTEAERQLVRRVEEFNEELRKAHALLKGFEAEFKREFPDEVVAA